MTSDERGPLGLRKVHRNSKVGCSTCKKRRIRCDETLPQCKNCVRYKAECGYLNIPKAELAELVKTKMAQETASHRETLTDSSASGSGVSQEFDNQINSWLR